MSRWLGVLVFGAVLALGCQSAETKSAPTPDPAKVSATEVTTAAATAAGDPSELGCGRAEGAGECGSAEGECPHAAKGGCPHAEAENDKAGEPCPCKAKGGEGCTGDGKGCEDCKAKGGCPHAAAEGATGDEPCPCKAKGATGCPHAGS